MSYVVENAFQSMARYGEELCGDHVEVMKRDNGTIMVLSDGLGSGVKANILATLTSKIAIGLIEKNLPLEEIIGTIIQTLPICDVREMAYSTLAVLEIFNDGQARLMELDTPAAFLLRQGKVQPLEMKERLIKGRQIREARFCLERGDRVFLASDGVIHAGIGGLKDFGLGWDGVALHLEEMMTGHLSLQEMINKLITICQAYYLLEPGDDFTILGAELRLPRNLTLMTGPPIETSDDLVMSQELLKRRGQKIICGGTTAQIFSRETDRELRCDFHYVDPEIPPISYIDGVDLVTEGLLTLNKALELIQDSSPAQPSPGEDGASLLARYLLESDQVHFLVGRAVNEAHQSLSLPVNLGIRSQVIERIVGYLQSLHKDVTVQWY